MRGMTDTRLWRIQKFEAQYETVCVSAIKRLGVGREGSICRNTRGTGGQNARGTILMGEETLTAAFRPPSLLHPSLLLLSLFSRGCAPGRYICGITVGIPFSGRA